MYVLSVFLNDANRFFANIDHPFDGVGQVGKVQLQPPASKLLSQTTPMPELQGSIKVSLHDCLACSGCVTSAETVLLQHQSTAEFMAKIADPSITVVVSLSPQSIVSLAAFYDIHPALCAARLTAALKSKGVAAVFDISWARDISLLESAAEFIHRCKSKTQRNDIHTSNQPLPMLASACPGWVCYAEKTHGSFVLPYIATTKSPQSIMGTLIKKEWAQQTRIPPELIYHCAVMPCYDKKLEAARDDFTTFVSSSLALDVSGAGAVNATNDSKLLIVPETDSVLATTELLDWLSHHSIDLNTFEEALPMDSPFTNQVPHGQGQIYSIRGGSGGYLEYVFRKAAYELHGQVLPAGPLPFIQGKNADFKEITLYDASGRPLLRFAAAHGFRNIQGLMRKIKLNKCEYDYIEVMACPSGCLNGGGQVKAREGKTPHQLIEELEAAYGDAMIDERMPDVNGSVKELYSVWVRGMPGSREARDVFHTQYHKREKTITAALADW